MITEEERTIQTGMIAVAVRGDFGFEGVADTGVGREEEGESSRESLSSYSASEASDFSSDMVVANKLQFTGHGVI